MNITIQTIGFTASEHLNTFLNKKMEKIFKHRSDIIRADVLLKKDTDNDPFNEWCEITVSKAGENQFVKKNAEKFEDAILNAVDAMDKILRRMKTKEIDARSGH